MVHENEWQHEWMEDHPLDLFEPYMDRVHCMRFIPYPGNMTAASVTLSPGRNGDWQWGQPVMTIEE
jgi:hypothetical protein